MKYFHFKFILLFYFLKTTLSNETSNSSIPQTTTTIESTTKLMSDSSSCEKCGENSERCIFNELLKTIKCECKSGFEGEFCNQKQTTISTSTITTPIINLIQTEPETTTFTTTIITTNYNSLKDELWNNILDGLGANNPNIALIENSINHVNHLFEELLLNKRIESLDVYRYAKVLNYLNNLSTRHFFINENTMSNLLNSLDIIISLDGIIMNDYGRSILSETNRNYNKSGLAMMQSIDELTKYLGFNLRKKTFRFKNFDTLILNLNPMNSEFQFEMKSKELDSLANLSVNKSLLIDTISLNENVLRKRYKNNSIKVSFKIFFNNNLKSYAKSGDDEDELKRAEFYKQLQKPKNFFYELTNSDDNADNLNNPADYFVSSNILSASIYETEESRQSGDDDVQQSTEKFVRIQFLVDLNNLPAKEKFTENPENNLKCVFWDEVDYKWSTRGCESSETESDFVKGSSFFRKVCYCDHLTNFALLFDPVSTFTSKNKANKFYNLMDKTLTVLTYVGLSVSSICYLIMIAYRLKCFKKENIYKYMSSSKETSSTNSARGVQKQQTRVYKNTVTLKLNSNPKSSNYRDKTLRRLYLFNSICLLVSNICFLLVLLVKPSASYTFCRINASILHYFLIASFCFSLGTAWQHFNKLVKIFSDYEYGIIHCFKNTKFILKWVVFSLAFPLVFATVGYYMNSKSLKESTNCWLRAPQIYYLFIAPLGFLITLSLIFYIFVVYKVVKIYSYGNNGCFGTNKPNDNQDLNNLNNSTSYNHKRVVVLLTFSFISLGLTWFIGVFIVIASHIDYNLKLALDFLFCLFNSFHGLSLLVGQYFALKYSKSGSYVTNKFTKTLLNQTSSNATDNGQKYPRLVNLNSREFIASTTTSPKNRPDSEPRYSYENNNATDVDMNKIDKKSRFYIMFFGILYGLSRLTKCDDKQKRNKQKNLKNIKNTKRNAFQLEFTIVNHEDSDSNNPNLHTIQTHLPFEAHRYNEYLPNYFDANYQDRFNLNKKPFVSNLAIEADQMHPFTSSV